MTPRGDTDNTVETDPDTTRGSQPPSNLVAAAIDLAETASPPDSPADSLPGRASDSDKNKNKALHSPPQNQAPAEVTQKPAVAPSRRGYMLSLIHISEPTRPY